MPLGTCQQWLHLLALDGFQVRTIEQTVSLLLPAASTLLMQAHESLHLCNPELRLDTGLKGCKQLAVQKLCLGDTDVICITCARVFQGHVAGHVAVRHGH